jgi:hypothetical protein
LRASLGTGALPDGTLLAVCDWARFERLALHHGLAPILYRAVPDPFSGLPTERRQRLKMQYVANVLHNKPVQACVAEMGIAFGSEGIPLILMKGAALACTLYPDAGLRILSDIDILVDEADVERAGARLRQIGLEPIAFDHTEARGPLCHIHLVYCGPQPRSIPVELHWRLFEPYQPYTFDLGAVRAQARQLPGLPRNVLAMASEHELAHLCVHLDRHAVTYRSLLDRKDWFELLLLPQGLGRLLWLYDIALYVQQRGAAIDWDAFVDNARRWAIDARVHATFELSRRVLGVVPPEEVVRALSGGRPRFVERVAHRAVLTAHRASELRSRGAARAQAARWLERLSGHALRFAHAWISVFPSSVYLRARYSTPGTSLSLRGRYVRDVAPGLWGEVRDRWRSAFAGRGRGTPR